MFTHARIVLGALIAAGFMTLGAAAQVTVNYDPNAPVSNFGAPTNANSNVAYTITMNSDYTNVNIVMQTVPTANTPVDPTLNFTNLYFSTNLKSGLPNAGGSNLGFEIQNQDAFTPGVSNNVSTVGTGITFSQPTAGTWDISIPWTFFINDPDNIGFTKISGTNDTVRLNLSQSFGYSVAGGQSFYGDTRLGEAELQAAPEPSTYSMFALALIALGFVARRRSTRR